MYMYTNHGSEVNSSNIHMYNVRTTAKTEVGASLWKDIVPSEARAMIVCKLAMTEVEASILELFTLDPWFI